MIDKKGIVLYASNTGNTKKMAEKIYEGLEHLCQMEIAKVSSNKNLEDYDFALVGSWIDQGYLEKYTLDKVLFTKQKNIGIFATMGYRPDSQHGKEVYENLNKVLEKKDSLGVQICHGKVAKQVIDNLQRIPEGVLPKTFLDLMNEASVHSREATEEELHKARDYFVEKIENLFHS